ncbi:hypothetical protein [Tessaracoccus sp.]
MFSPDDFTPALIALPYLAATAKVTIGLFRPRLLASRPAWCNYFPFLCR